MKRSKIMTFFAILAAVCTIGAFAACKSTPNTPTGPNPPNGGDTPTPPANQVVITFVCANEQETVSVEKGKTVTAADFDSYVVLDWKKDDGTSFDFSSTVETNLTLTADCYSKGLIVEDGKVTEFNGTSTAVIIPSEINGEKITAIGRNVFYNNLDMYDKIVSVSVAEGITTIDNRAFNGLEVVESITLPASVTSFGTDCFIGCPKLLVSFAGNTNYPKDESGIVYTDPSKTKILFYAGERGGDVELSITNIDKSALLNAQIGRLTLTNDVKSVGTTAFAFSTVTEVVWNTTASIPTDAFSSCVSLKKITIAEGVTEIGVNAFNGAAALSEVVLPTTLQKLGANSFANCASLTEIDLEKTKVNTIIGNEFRGAGLKSFFIPEGVTEIAAGMFTDWKGLETIDFGNVTKIGENAFQNCISLKNITIPAQVETICEKAFAGCSALEEVNFEQGSKLKILGDTSSNGNSNVFTGTNISTLELPDSLQEIKAGALSGMSRLTNLSLPFVGTYSVDGWKKFLSDWHSNATPAAEENNPNLVAAYEKYCMSNADELNQFLLSKQGAFSQGQLFGYIFGTTAYAGGTECAQVAAETYSNKYTYRFQIPTTLRSVKITGTSLIPAYSFNMVTVNFALDKTSSITQIGAYAFSYCLNYREYDFSNNLTYIGDYAFDSCRGGVNTLVLPDSVTYVGAYSFRNNIYLIEVKLPDNANVIINSGALFNDQYREGMLAENRIYTIYQNPANKKSGYCTVERGALGTSVFYQAIFEHAVLGENVRYLTNLEYNDDYFCAIFNNCIHLKTVQMTDDLRGKVNVGGVWDGILGGNFFSGCTALVRLNSNNDGEFNIPKCTAIAYGAFNSVVGMKNLVLSRECERIGSNSFANSGLQTADIRYVRVVGGAAFYRCYDLTEVTWGSDIDEFQLNAGIGLFQDCAKLSRFNSYDVASGVLTTAEDGECHIPNISALPQYGFKSLPIKKVFIPSTLTELPLHTFYGCALIESITIPGNITRLGSGVFVGCASLKEVIFETKSLTTLPSHCFQNCTTLEEFIVPYGITTIETQAFAGCTSLKNVVIPATVTRLEGNRQFADCSSLKSLWLMGSFPPNVDAGFGAGTLFYSSALSTQSVAGSLLPELLKNGFRIYVPADALDSYKTHNSSYSNNAIRLFGWKNYADAFAPVYTGKYVDTNGNSLLISMEGYGKYFATLSNLMGKYELTPSGNSFTFNANSTEYTITASVLSATVTGGGNTLNLTKLSGLYFDFTKTSPEEQILDLFNKKYPDTSKPMTPDEKEKFEKAKAAEKVGIDGIIAGIEGDNHFYNNLELTDDGQVKFMVIKAFRDVNAGPSQYGYLGYYFTPAVLEGTYAISGNTLTFTFNKLLTYNGTLGASNQYHDSWAETVTVNVSLSDFLAGTANISMPAMRIYKTSTSTPTNIAAAEYNFTRTQND